MGRTRRWTRAVASPVAVVLVCMGVGLAAWTTGCRRSPSDEAGSNAASAPDAADVPDATGGGKTVAPEGDSRGDAAEDSGSAEAVKATGELLSQIVTAEEVAQGWIALFDGETLFGWQQEGKANWHVDQGAIVVDTGPPGLLVTTTEWGDFELKLEFLAAATTNSGVFLLTGPKPGNIERDCYELNIAWGDHPFPTGSLVRRARADDVPATDTWQQFHVTHANGKITVRVNGKQVLDYTDPDPIRRGRIGLQLNHGRVAFRNIKLKPSATESLFNGKDLAGWREYPDMKSRFSVNQDGWLQVTNGRGQLESERRFADFVLQLQCRTQAAGLNSGVFFRCMPGEEMNGYECQIHNGFQGGDRNRPVDCGTGGFFRRQDARRVVADDQQWFALTLAADGPHMAAWVNGFPVSDWTDTREPDANPRRGLRLEPGTIMIQGHDPTTDILFRKLSIAELPGRRSP